MKPTPRDGLLRGRFAALVRVLLLAAAGISAYLLSVSLRGGSAVGCGPGSSCDAVLQSPWAYVLGIPVSALALVVDLALLLTTFGCGPRSTPKQRRGAWEIIVPCALLVFGAALWFTGLQAFVIHRFCPWCMTAHTCGAVAAVLLFTRLPLTEARTGRDQDAALPRSSVVRLALAALLALALFGAAQIIAPRPTYSVSTIPTATSNSIVLAPPSVPPSTNTVARTAVTNAPRVVAAPVTNHPAPVVANVPTLDLFGGRIRLDLTQVPVWGWPTAPFKLLSLHDYTCSHCREMHSRVLEVQRSFGDKLAVVSLPMPLDAQCNSLMRATPRPHTNACQYAKLSLIVWHAKHGAIQPFDDWLFGFQKPPPLIDVTNKAVELVGTVAFEIASRDPRVEEQIRQAVEIYGISAREFRNGSMPQFMIGTNIVSGTLTTGQLRAVIAPYVEGRR